MEITIFLKIINVKMTMSHLNVTEDFIIFLKKKQKVITEILH